ncbi:MAG: pyridoxamine 5'-phosphate oxidase [Mariniphaga sp.]|nr:pyridoxamine 5'-phosphate oxidase [Mariniphaga sp.]
MNIHSLRKEYLAGTLSEDQLQKDPLILFKKWFDEVLASEMNETNAMNLSTIGTDGYPETRIVLLKSIEPKGLSFFTNYNSRKAEAMDKNRNVSLTFFWPQFQRQVRIKGTVSKVQEKISDEYFATRPYESNLGAWASNQSEVIISREELENSFNYFKEKFKDGEIPRPPHWGGYIVKPISIEFWQGRENRLHDRFLYEKIKNNWKIKRLAP